MNIRLCIDLKVNKSIDEIDEQLKRDVQIEVESIAELVKSDIDSSKNSLLKMDGFSVRSIPKKESGCASK